MKPTLLASLLAALALPACTAPTVSVGTTRPTATTTAQPSSTTLLAAALGAAALGAAARPSGGSRPSTNPGYAPPPPPLGTVPPSGSGYAPPPPTFARCDERALQAAYLGQTGATLRQARLPFPVQFVRAGDTVTSFNPNRVTAVVDSRDRITGIVCS